MNANLKAAIWMIGAIVSFSVMAVSGREVSAELDTFEIMLFRSLVGIVIVVALTTATGKWSEITTQDLPLHGARNLAHFAGQNLWFFALTAMPLAQLFAVEFTTPIWVLLLSPVLLSRPIRPIGFLSALIAFGGILMVARPGVTPIGIGFVTAAISAVCFALSLILTKKLTTRHSITAILFYLTVMQAAFGLAAAGFDFDITAPSTAAIPYVIVIGISGLLAHFCITNALKIAHASVVAPIDFARLPVIAVVGALLYGESLDIWVLIGAIVIFSGNYLNIISENRQKPKMTEG